MAEAVRFDDRLAIRCPPDVREAVNRAALRKGTKASEWARQALQAALRAEGWLPDTDQQYALVANGELVRGLRSGAPITTLHPDHDERGDWLPIENEDDGPFDPALHWRLKPLPLRVDGERVVRVYPVAERS